MKEYIKDIIEESLKDEVDVDREWERLFSSIEKKTISKMKTRGLFPSIPEICRCRGFGHRCFTINVVSYESRELIDSWKL